MTSKYACLEKAFDGKNVEEPAILFLVIEKTKTEQWKNGVTVSEVTRELNRHKAEKVPDVPICIVKDLMQSMADHSTLVRIPGVYMGPERRGKQARYLLPEGDGF